MKKLLSQIKPSPINEEIYSTTDLSDLELSCKSMRFIFNISLNTIFIIKILSYFK